MGSLLKGERAEKEATQELQQPFRGSEKDADPFVVFRSTTVFPHIYKTLQRSFDTLTSTAACHLG